MNKRRGDKNVTRRQDVTALIARGFSNKEIASELGLSEWGVRWYISTIYREHGFYGASARWRLIVSEFKKAIQK